MTKHKNKWIREGMEVAHYDNLNQKMFVEKFIKEILKDDSPAKEDAITENGNRVFIRNVKCHWWESSNGQRLFKEGFFHTKELVPWEVAVEGYTSAIRFLG